MERNNENNINNEIYLNQGEDQDAEIQFNRDLANQEWINEKNFLRMVLMTPCSVFSFKPLANDTIMLGPIVHDIQQYIFSQNKFSKATSLGNRICSIDLLFANNTQFMQMLSQKYFTESDFRRHFFGPMSVIRNTYVRAMLEKKLINSKEVKRFIVCYDDEGTTPWITLLNEGLSSKDISLNDRKEFDNIVNYFFDLLDSFMQPIFELYFKHTGYAGIFFYQGETDLHFNVNTTKKVMDEWIRDFNRSSVLRDFLKNVNSRKWETLSYYSRHMILCFFRPEYLYKNEKPDKKLVEFYVALNSLLSVTEKENAKAILNLDDKKLTEQQKDLKKKLSGEDEKFRNNIINAWKDGFFLDKNKIQESNKLFTEKEKKFKAAFYKSRVMDLVIEIEHGNLNLIQNKNLKNDLSSKDNNDDKVEFLVNQLFSGACITDKNNKTYLEFYQRDREEHANKALSEKLELIVEDHTFPSNPPKSAFVYDENNGLVKIIDWLISEIENGNLNLISQDQNENLKNGLLNENNNVDKVNFLLEKLFGGARVVDKDKNDIIYLKFSPEEIDKYSGSGLEEQLKLIDKKIQSCPKAAKILKPSDFILNVYDYQHLRKERLSELLYFKDDKQKRDYIYLRENKDYYRDYVLHQDYGENELYNKLYQCTQKADFGKYKQEHFIFDKNGTIIGIDVLAYFADKIVSGELKLKGNNGKDVSDKVKDIDNDLAREVFLMDKLKNNAYSIFDDNENKEIKMSSDDMSQRTHIVTELTSTIQNLRTKYMVNKNAINDLFSNLYSDGGTNKTMKDFIKMFRLEKEDVEEIVGDTKQPHALIYRYALNKIFTEKIKPVNQKGQKLIDEYVFDFSGTNCEQDDLVFAKDGRVEYVKYESLPKVLKLDDIETNELKARNRFIGAYEQKEKYKSNKAEIEIDLHDVKINSKELSNKLKEKYKVNEENPNSAKDELSDLRTNLDSNACTNLNDFYDPDSYRDELLDDYIKFYQNAGISYEYWCSECAKKFLENEKKEKSNDDIAAIELKFFKGQKIELKDLSQYTKNNKQEEITDIELKLFEENKIKFNNLSKYTKDNKQKEIAEIEFELLKENKLNGDRKKNRQLQKQKSKLMSVYYRLAPGEINNQNKLEQVCIGGETILYFLEDTKSQQLNNDINDLKKRNINLCKLKNIPYKNWDSDAREDYFDKLQWKWFKIGCIPLSILILSVVSFFLPFIEGYLVIKIIFTSGSFVCGCLVAGKGIKNKKDRYYDGPDTYDNLDYNYPNNNFIKLRADVSNAMIQESRSLVTTSPLATKESLKQLRY